MYVNLLYIQYTLSTCFYLNIRGSFKAYWHELKTAHGKDTAQISPNINLKTRLLIFYK